jgi:hypothetical protein
MNLADPEWPGSPLSINDRANTVYCWDLKKNAWRGDFGKRRTRNLNLISKSGWAELMADQIDMSFLIPFDMSIGD